MSPPARSSFSIATSTPRSSFQTFAKQNHHHHHNDDKTPSGMIHNVLFQKLQHACAATLLALSLTTTTALPAMATDSGAIVSCLFQKCALPLGKCIVNPNCLANVICINTCNNRPDETECQIQCGNLFENDVVGEFNKCAVSDMSCVPKKEDDGSYPVPTPDKLVPKFDTSFFNGRLYITAGQNKLFDIFPCQVHFFTETEPGKFFGKLNWRVEEPDGTVFSCCCCLCVPLVFGGMLTMLMTMLCRGNLYKRRAAEICSGSQRASTLSK